MKRVLVFGTFDNLHSGHRFVLREALKRGQLFVAVGLDGTVEKIKGRKPMQNQDERRRAIASEFPEAHVFLGDDIDYLKPVREVEPDLILMGYDQELPPGISKEDLPCTIESLEAFEPSKYKSSFSEA